jgi:hypothetical protein
VLEERLVQLETVATNPDARAGVPGLRLVLGLLALETHPAQGSCRETRPRPARTAGPMGSDDDASGIVLAPPLGASAGAHTFRRWRGLHGCPLTAQ